MTSVPARRVPTRAHPMREAHVTGDVTVLCDITPEMAGWNRSGLQVLRLAAGATVDLDAGGSERAMLPLVGGCTVSSGGRTIVLAGRQSVFSHVSDWAYVGCHLDARITAQHGCEIAIASARAERRIDPYRVDAADVPVEVRGAGTSTRQLNNFLAPGIADADRLVAVEVLTPRGNWSSWPAHKHDHELRDASGAILEAELEEIYYYRISTTSGGTHGAAREFGMHRTYDLADQWDMSTMVQSDDAVLVPSGYHGPCVAAPEYDMYYLNVLAGEQPERTLAFTDDPALAWIRESWTQQAADPRVPFTSAGGPVGPGTSPQAVQPMSVGRT
jgi:5-deoxy-glucuronate isomerase